MNVFPQRRGGAGAVALTHDQTSIEPSTNDTPAREEIEEAATWGVAAGISGGLQNSGDDSLGELARTSPYTSDGEGQASPPGLAPNFPKRARRPPQYLQYYGR